MATFSMCRLLQAYMHLKNLIEMENGLVFNINRKVQYHLTKVRRLYSKSLDLYSSLIKFVPRSNDLTCRESSTLFINTTVHQSDLSTALNIVLAIVISHHQREIGY